MTLISDLIEYGETVAPRITRRLLLLHPLGVFISSDIQKTTTDGELGAGGEKSSEAMNDDDDDDVIAEGAGQVSPLLISPLAYPYAFGVDDDDDDRHYPKSKADLASSSLTGLLTESGKNLSRNLSRNLTGLLTGRLTGSESHAATSSSSSSSSLLEKTVDHIEETIDKTMRGTWMDYFQIATSPLSSARSQKAGHGLFTGSGKDLTGDLIDSSKDLTGHLTDSPRPQTAPRSSHSGRSFNTTSGRSFNTTSTVSSSGGWLDENNRSSYFLRSFDSHVSSEAGHQSACPTPTVPYRTLSLPLP